MREVCEEFLLARLPLPGTAAYALGLPDGSVTQRGFNRWLNPPQVQLVFGELADTFALLRQQQIAASRLTWVFEHLQVMFRLRPDRVCLALFLENRPDLPLVEIKSMLDDFAALPLPNR